VPLQRGRLEVFLHAALELLPVLQDDLHRVAAVLAARRRHGRLEDGGVDALEVRALQVFLVGEAAEAAQVQAEAHPACDGAAEVLEDEVPGR